MMLRPLTLLASVALLALCACSSSPWSRPVTDPGRPLALEGLEVLPPQGTNWFVAARDDRSVVFARKHGDEAASTIASAAAGEAERTFASPAAFLAHVERVLRDGRDSRRAIGATCEARLTRRHGLFCVEYLETFLDRSSPAAPGRTLRTENRGCWFIDPTDPRRSVALLYSMRRPSAEPPGTGAAAERFFSGVRLTGSR